MKKSVKKKSINSSKTPITEPTLPPFSKVISKYRQIFKNRHITNGEYVRKLEEAVKRHVGVKHAIAVNSCTSGLMLILRSLCIKGEVILPSFTFYATGHAILWNNLKPVFADCDRDTYCMSPQSVRKAITRNTAAIIGVHIFGNPADVKELESISKKHNIYLLFDAAHGFGARINNIPVGRFGIAESFSMSPTKLVTAAEGGMVTTNNDDLAKKVMIGRTYGDSGIYDCEYPGLSARMSELHAILALESLLILEQNVRRRHRLVAVYKKELDKVPGISFQTIKKGNRSSYKDLSIEIDPTIAGISRDAMTEILASHNISTKKYFSPPLHKQKIYREFYREDSDLRTTEMISDRVLSLPLFSHMGISEVVHICHIVKDIILHSKKAINP